MTYTFELTDWEAIALATLMKEEFKKNIEFLKENEKACKAAPELSSFSDYTMKEQVLYDKVYRTIWNTRHDK